MPDPSWTTVRLEVGSDFQRATESNLAGTHFVIASGVHRMQQVQPKNAQTFTGEPGAVMSGARVLDQFKKEGTAWVAEGQTQQGFVHPDEGNNIMLSGYERDNRPEELWLQNKRLRHVGSVGEVGPGKWFFDYTADRIYLGDDPTGKTVETAVSAYAFGGKASDVIIENLTIRHYASPAQRGAIHAQNGPRWTIRYVDASYNHGLGIHTGPATKLSNSRMTYNGQMGLRGDSNDTVSGLNLPMVIESNEISHNRQLGYNWMWEGGAMKILHSTGTRFVNNWVHDNLGPGIWFDGFNRKTTIESNLTENNTYSGIFYEISYGPTLIRWNTVRSNGVGQAGCLGVGICISNSRDIEVIGNAVYNNQSGILLTMVSRETGPDGQLELAGVKVRENDVKMASGSTGLVDETGNNAYYESKGNEFTGNTYRLDPSYTWRFNWTGRWWPAHSWAEWQSFGNDQGGRLLDASGTPQLPLGAVGYLPVTYGITG